MPEFMNGLVIVPLTLAAVVVGGIELMRRSAIVLRPGPDGARFGVTTPV